MIGWTAVVFAIQSWLNESPAQVAAGKQPGYFAVGMAFMSLMLVGCCERSGENGANGIRLTCQFSSRRHRTLQLGQDLRRRWQRSVVIEAYGK